MPNLKLFLLALGFYTRFPVPKNQDYSGLPQASVYLPLIGWLVGGSAGLCFYLADLLLPTTTAVILALIGGILLTGAFHEDGFADVCDGFGGGYGKQQILDIMKDSRIGAYGTLGLILLIALKISLLTSLSASEIPFALIAGHSTSRLQPLFVMRRYPYARTGGGKSHVALFKPGFGDLMFAAIVAFLPLLFLPDIGLLAIPVVVLSNWQLGRYFYRHIGGYTGDCLGASQQVAEVVFYLGIVGLWTYS